MTVAYSNNLIYNSRVDRFATEKADSDRPATLIHRMDTTEVSMIKKVCPICGQEFTTKNKRQKFCSISCGVHSRDRHLEGQKFGRWTVLERAEKHPKTGSTMWLCSCECGTEKVVSELSLVRGKSKSCGCLHTNKLTTHNMAYSRIYNIWGHIKGRCTNPRHHAWKDYGGRGITVCDEWLSFEPFYDWAMSNGYKEDLSIDRINVNGNYEPNNCRWVTIKEQNRNRRNNKLITYNNETHCIAEWAEVYNVNRKKLEKDIRQGMSLEDAIKKEIK